MSGMTATGPVIDDASAAVDLGAGEPGGRSPPAGSGRWPLSVGSCWGLAATALALAVAMAVTALADGDVFILPLVPSPIVWAVMGGLVAVRRPGHPMGLLLCAGGLADAFSGAAFAYARAAVIHFPATLPFGRPAMWLTAWSYVPAVCLSGLIVPLVFPDGHLLSRRWRPVLWAVVAYAPLAAVGNAFSPQSMGGWFRDQPSPYAISGPLFPLILDLSSVLGLAAGVAALASLALRWRRAGHTTRQQIRWFLAAAPLMIAAIVVTQYFPDALTLGLVLGAVASALTAAALGLAVLRYRLYEIEVLLSRAVVYGVLSVALAGLYLAVVAIAGGSVGTGGGLSVQLVAMVVAAAVLLPVRGRLQRRVDQLFFGDRGWPYFTMARLGRRVEEAAKAEPVLGSVVTTVAVSLRLPYAAVQLRIADRWVPNAAWGQAPADVVAFPLTFQRETVGRLLVGQRAPRDRLSQDDERLLANLASQVAPAAHAVALRQALDASRAGLVNAREEERRRLRRDLHDELGPTIAGLTLGLDTAAAMCAGQHELAQLLAGLKAESQRAVTDIRRITYGLRPPALDEAGLVGALRAEVEVLERQAPGLSIALHIPDGDFAELPAAIEVAAYRIVTEAVTNVLRHAGARYCDVRIRTGHDLRLEVCDDGAGMPEGWRAGVGITAMRERVAELGGELTIAPRIPTGTRVDAWLPLGRPG
jgi:two-component system NarL family sensor kinase